MMSKRKSVTFSDVTYSKLVVEDDVDFSSDQFDRPPTKIPWKAISLAIFLCLTGGLLLSWGTLIITGHIEDKHNDRLYSIFLLGGIMFLPGFYHIRIAYHAFRRTPGFSFEDIPEFE